MVMENWVCLKWQGRKYFYKQIKEKHAIVIDNASSVYLKTSACSGKLLVEVPGTSTIKSKPKSHFIYSLLLKKVTFVHQQGVRLTAEQFNAIFMYYDKVLYVCDLNCKSSIFPAVLYDRV